MLELGLFLTCLLAGVINSVAGGGIFVVFPTLLAAGFPPITANATSNIASWPGTISAAFSYRKHLRRLPAHFFLLLLPCIAGTLIGCYLLTHTSGDAFEQIVPWLVLGAVVLFAFQPRLHSYLARTTATRRSTPLVLIAAILLLMAVYGGYFGAGFGFLMLAFLGFSRLRDLYQMNGLKNIASATVTLICTAYFGFSGLIDWQFAPFMIAGSLLGGFLGAHYSQKLNPRIVHGFIIFLGLIVTAALFMRQ